jgi:hypothetical protein
MDLFALCIYGCATMENATQLIALTEALDEINASLAQMALTPRVNDYQAAAHAYQRMVESWPITAPSQEQRDAIFDCVMELHSEVVAVSGCRQVASAFIAFVESQIETGT